MQTWHSTPSHAFWCLPIKNRFEHVVAAKSKQDHRIIAFSIFSPRRQNAFNLVVFTTEKDFRHKNAK